MCVIGTKIGQGYPVCPTIRSDI